MSCRTLHSNFVDLDIVSNNYVSSAQAAFPVTNIYNKQRRSKVWRSNGYWEITATNKQLVFQETTAVDLTATVVEGAYTSTTALLAALKTALGAAGASTYTCSVDTVSLKIKITSNGAGGGGILTLRTSAAASSGLAAALGFDTSVDRTGALTYTADLLRLATSEWVKWDFGITANPRAFILIGKRNEPIQLTPAGTYTLQGNPTDVWTSPAYSTAVPHHDQAMTLFGTTGLHTGPLRFWRFNISDLANPNGYVEIGSVFLGDYLTLARGAPQFPLNLKPIDRSETVFSEGGQSFSDIREKSEQFRLDYKFLTVADKELLETHFSRVGTAVPFFVALDPDGFFSSSSNLQVKYAKFAGEPDFSLERAGQWSMSATLREEL